MKKTVIYHPLLIFCLIVILFFSCKKDNNTPINSAVICRVLNTADLFFPKIVATPIYDDSGRLLSTTIATVAGTYKRYFTYKGNTISIVADNNDPLHPDSLTVTLNNLGLISTIRNKIGQGIEIYQTFKHDANGFLISRSDSSLGHITETTTYTYINGDLAYRHTPYYTNADTLSYYTDKPSSIGTEYVFSQFEYYGAYYDNKSAHLLKSIKDKLGGLTNYTYIFDSDGRVVTQIKNVIDTTNITYDCH